MSEPRFTHRGLEVPDGTPITVGYDHSRGPAPDPSVLAELRRRDPGLSVEWNRLAGRHCVFHADPDTGRKYRVLHGDATDARLPDRVSAGDVQALGGPRQVLAATEATVAAGEAARDKRLADQCEAAGKDVGRYAKHIPEDKK